MGVSRRSPPKRTSPAGGLQLMAFHLSHNHWRIERGISRRASTPIKPVPFMVAGMNSDRDIAAIAPFGALRDSGCSFLIRHQEPSRVILKPPFAPGAPLSCQFAPLMPFSRAANMPLIPHRGFHLRPVATWVFAPCLALADTADASLALCPSVKLTHPPSCLHAPLAPLYREFNRFLEPFDHSFVIPARNNATCVLTHPYP